MRPKEQPIEPCACIECGGAHCAATDLCQYACSGIHGEDVAGDEDEHLICADLFALEPGAL